MPKKILLADDSITIQKVVELTFSDGDYEVTAVNNGAKAVQKLAEMRPDIILSDIIMPEKNGYEVCEYVKSHPEFRNIPVVLLTGTFEPFDPDRAEKAGCDAVVTKPFESQSLIHKVEELIAQSRTSAPAPAPEPEAPAPSPWMEETTEVQPMPEAPPAFTTASGSFPTSDSFEHGSDIFGAAAPSTGETTEMPFETPSDSPFGAPPEPEAFSGETRAFPKMSLEDMQRMAAETAPPPPPESPAPEPSPWDEPAQSPFAAQPEAAFGGETRAFPKMSFEDMQSMAGETAAPAPEPTPEAESDSPFGAPPPAEEFSGETRAFPKMSFEDMQRMAAETAPPPPPEPAAPEPSPWEEQAAPPTGSETRAFPPLSFDETPAEAEAPAWSTEPEMPEAETAQAMPEDLPFAAETTAPPPPGEAFTEVPPPGEPAWEPAAAAEAEAERFEEPVPSPALAPEPAIPISTHASDLTDDQVDRIARRVVELMSDHVVRNIAWEVIPDLAEMVVKERIRQLESEA
ncbi:MAG TPA: response regulator [Thermoanaerobaculia bacterium]|nr:response regulator [Thermoanaerobaculia bacterium]